MTNDNESMEAVEAYRCREQQVGVGYVCTRTKGHAGDHVAHTGLRRKVARWPADDAPVEPTAPPVAKCDGCGMAGREVNANKLCLGCMTCEAVDLYRALEAEKAKKQGALDTRREKIATQVMLVYISRGGWQPKDAAVVSVKYADALLAELAKPREEK